MREENRLVELGAPQQRALLALLLLNANEVVSRDRLIDELWGESPPGTAAKLVQVYVSRLRKALEPGRAAGGEVLLTRAPGYMLRVDPGQLDLDRFQALVDEGRKAIAARAPREAAERLRAALAIWRGPPLADLEFEQFAQAEIARLEELRLAALEDRIDADLAEGGADLVGELEALIARHPLRERLRRQLMLALYRSGRQAEALQAYREAHRALTEELGITPGRELRELQRAILRQDAELDHRPAGEGAAGSRGLFVGRERELAELVGGLDDAFAGRGRLVLLAGEPGIGKSRLIEEVIEAASERGATVLIGRCWEAGGAPPYWPWVQAMRGHVRAADPNELRAQVGEGAADLAQVLPELRGVLGEIGEPPTAEAEGARFRLFEAVSAFLRGVTAVNPLVLVLDDLHAADEPSLLLLRFVAREIREARILLISAFRDVDPLPQAALTEALAEVAREPHASRIGLTGLSEADIAEYVERVTGMPSQPEVAATVRSETEGNPLFVVELVRLLRAKGGIDRAGGPLGIPSGIRDVIRQRVGRLSERCREVLPSAAVMGREFEVETLARLAGLAPDQLLEVLDESIAERILGEVPGSPGRIRFGHALIRDTLYDELTPARRMQLHGAAARALESVHADDPGPHLTELAHHYLAAAPAGMAGEAVDYARQAGDRAAAQLAFEEAARLYEAALALTADTVTRCDLLLAIGDAYARAGDSKAAKRTFREAAELAEEGGLDDRLAHAALGYGGRIIWERHQDDAYLVPLLERAAAALGKDDRPLRVQVLARLAGGPLRSAQFPVERRVGLSREALEMARRLGDPATLAYALDARIPAIESPANTEETLELSTELLEVAVETGDRERLLEAHEHRHERYLELCEMREATAELDAMAKLAEELRQPAQRWLVTACQARLTLLEGRFGEAEKLILEARDLGERALSWNAAVAFRAQLYMLRRERGQLDAARELLTNSAVEYPDYELWPYALVQLDSALGLEAESRRGFESLAADDFATLPFDCNAWFVGMGLLAETAVSLADSARAAILYDLLLPYADRAAVIYPELGIGSVSRYLGILAAARTRWEDAERHFEGALVTNERIGARPWLAHTQHDYGEMLRSRGRSGDSERAEQLLSDAVDIYRDLGMDSHAASASSRG